LEAQEIKLKEAGNFSAEMRRVSKDERDLLMSLEKAKQKDLIKS
jgi:hypothetical protein